MAVITSAFNPAAGFGSPSPETPRQTVLGALTGDATRFRVDVSNLGQYRINGNLAGAGNLVQPNREAVAPVADQVQKAQADISQAIKQAQTEVTAAMRSAGADPARMYPGLNFSQSGIAGLTASAATEAAAPGASAALNLISLGTARSADQKTMSPDEIRALEAEIEAALRESSRLQETDLQNEAMIADAKASAEGSELGASGLDWNAFFDEGHGISDLLALDPENPEPLPEWGELKALEAEIGSVLDDIGIAETEAELTGDAFEGNDETLLRCASMSDWFDCLSMTLSEADEMASVKETGAGLNNEFDVAEFNQSFNMNAGLRL